MSSQEARISPHSLNDLKNTSDDALANYLRGLSFQQDNSKLDFRLAVGYVSVTIAGVLFAADYKLGWEATRTWTAVAVGVYAILNAIFTYWMWAVEKGLVFEGARVGGKKISIASKTKKHDPTYYLTVSSEVSGSDTPRQWKIQAPFTTWFTADGYFVAKPFQRWLATTVDVIGNADPKNVGQGEPEGLLAPSVELAYASGPDPALKGTKRAKKKS